MDYYGKTLNKINFFAKHLTGNVFDFGINYCNLQNNPLEMAKIWVTLTNDSLAIFNEVLKRRLI